MDAPSKGELLASISPEMKLTKNFFKRTYGYELSFPGFSEQAIAALEAAGCSMAREHYNTWVREYEAEQAAVMKEVGKWYRKECEKQWEAKGRRGDQVRRWNLQDLTEQELTELCLTLLKEGVIGSPEEFAMAVLPDQ